MAGLAYAPGEGPPTDTQIADMRRANICVMHELAPGMVYAPVGGGYATDGTSINVVRSNDALVRQLRDTEDATQPFEHRLRDELRREDNTELPDPVQVRLERRPNGDLVAIVGANVAAMTVGSLNLV